MFLPLHLLFFISRQTKSKDKTIEMERSTVPDISKWTLRKNEKRKGKERESGSGRKKHYWKFIKSPVFENCQ